jgi:hypothetical protein
MPAADARVLVVAVCPHDKSPLFLAPTVAGRVIRCPGCGRRFQAPTATFGADDWRACRVLWLAIRYLDHCGAPPSARKRRLLVCGVCRLCWDQLPDICRRIVEVAERFADGLVGEAERAEAEAVADRHLLTFRGDRVTRAWNWAVRVWQIVHADYGLPPDWLSPPSPPPPDQGKAVTLFREVVGDPFRPPVIEASWLAWDGGAVRQMAEAIYDEQAFDRLPILADALEDAGCVDADLLGHLRGPGPHVRGCWAIDLILGKS